MRTARILICGAAVVALPFVLPTFAIAQPSIADFDPSAPLGLQRLSNRPAVEGRSRLSRDKFEVANLAALAADPEANASGIVKSRGGIGYVEIGSGAQWSCRLRPARGTEQYVTFTVNAAIGTRLSVAGALIGIEPTQRGGVYAALTYGAEGVRGTITWQPLNHEVPLLPFGGVLMAPLDVVTIKLDRAGERWSIWFRDTLVAEDLASVPAQRGVPKRLAISAGEGGAWLCGLVCGDENPLFTDANDNGVPDDFETASLGGLLEPGAAADLLGALRALWREDRRSRPPSVFIQTTPLPDAFPDWCEPEGAPVHGMPDSFRFGAAGSN